MRQSSVLERERAFTAFAAYDCMFLQAIRQLEAEIETTRKAMIANTGTQDSLEKRLLDYRGNLILKFFKPRYSHINSLD